MALFGRDYDSVQVGGDFKPLPAGGYICRIIGARITSNSNGLPMVEAAFDIVEGEYSNYFSKKHQENLKRNPKSEYPYNGRAKVTAVDAEGHTKKTFKGFVTAVEESNGMTLPREDNAFINALNGKLVGVIFGREEFQASDGKVHWATKPRWYRSVQTIESGEYPVPDDVTLEASNGGYYGSIPSNMSVAEEDIPW